MISTDVFSITNPALGSLLLWSFLQGYESNEKAGCPLPLLFLPPPLVLSQSVRDEFRGTNAETGLYTWIARKPMILINLNIRIEQSSHLTRNAISFASANQLLSIQGDGHVLSNNKGIVKGRINNSSDEIKEILQVSNRLGKWFSQINSTSSILNSLGLTL
ncbi:three component ABC system middle component [Paenibacillus sp. FSL R5-0490]|uniref:three component ABC system middle component n=1 Tax=Paenibacillus sp. FSL R5-0490 TaxID=1920424 RepID=UPI0030D228EE